MRSAQYKRVTKETDISVDIELDGSSRAIISTGIGFFDHMLTSFAYHAGFNLELRAAGDLEVDCHHTVEDAGLALGEAVSRALGDKSGVARFGSALIPMDEALARCVVDISGREYLVFDAQFKNERVGGLDTCMVEEFFRAFSNKAGITLHIGLLYGKNDHHCIEAIFKAVAYAMKQAVKPLDDKKALSTKGAL